MKSRLLVKVVSQCEMRNSAHGEETSSGVEVTRFEGNLKIQRYCSHHTSSI